jgi:sec-independent protein translocase protein TatC
MMRLHRIGDEEEVGLVDHLDELRSRIIVSVIALTISISTCFWQNHRLLHLLNGPLGHKPVVFGVTESFMSTLTVSAWTGLILALPVVLWQLYAFVFPALSHQQRQVARPLLLGVPLLFITGIVFAWLIVIPHAVTWLLNFNHQEFRIIIQAQNYYGFITKLALIFGIIFQLPVALLAAIRVGVVTVAQLRHSRRWAILAISLLTLFIPAANDPVAMVLIMLPLYGLYEISLLLAVVMNRLTDRAIAAAESVADATTPSNV